MAAATARGASDGCIFAVPFQLCARRSRTRAPCALYRTPSRAFHADAHLKPLALVGCKRALKCNGAVHCLRY